MDNILPIYAIAVATIMLIGETLVVFRFGKYWPLAADDYVTAAMLITGALLYPSRLGGILLLVAWAFSVGNIYAMLFTRLDPETGDRQRLPALMALLVLGGVGLTMTAINILNMEKML